MGINVYWQNQRIADLAIACAITLVSHGLYSRGYYIIVINSANLARVAQESFSASVSLFGLVSATIAFVFSAIEADQFRILRQSKSRKQMWDIFSFTLVCLLVSSAWSFFLMIRGEGARCTEVIIFVTTFVVALVSILISKFTWVMTKIIAVKAIQG